MRKRKGYAPVGSDRNEEVHFCGECALVTVETKPYTLSLEGRPTLGRCPHYTHGKWCVLLSQRSCGYFEKRTDV